jgi:hypothetical protein
MTGRPLVVRADATPEIGAGHLMRCITLAEAWAAEGFGQAVIWGTVSIPFVNARLRECGIRSILSPPDDPSSVLIVDSYDEDIRRSVLSGSPARLRVLVDDLGVVAEGYDVIWNPNAYSADGLYTGFEGRVISGEETVPIRSGLPKWAPKSSAIAVSLGGTRPPAWLVEALRIWSSSLAEPPVTGESSWVPSSWRTVPAAQAWSGFAMTSMLVSSAGSTVWEAAHVGIPLCLIVTAPNQVLAARWATGRGIPQVNGLGERDPAGFAASLHGAVADASALPHLKSGARSAVRAIRQLVAEGEHQ